MFGRGGEEFLGTYRILDVMPKGRDENWPYHTLAEWVRPHNRYGQGGMVEASGPNMARTSWLFVTFGEALVLER